MVQRTMPKTPTVKALKEIIKRLEGKETFDRDGLAPRRTEFFDSKPPSKIWHKQPLNRIT